MTRNPKYKRYRISFRDEGKIFYEKGLAYRVKNKRFGDHRLVRYVWVRDSNMDFKEAQVKT